MKIWRKIKGYPNYSISRFGVVINDTTNHQLKGCIGNGVHLRVSLCNGKPKNFNIHSLVAEAFIGPRPKDKVVDHIDNNPLNNRADNLQYISIKENTRKYYRFRGPTACVVTSCTKVNPWRGCYTIDGKIFYTGNCKTKAEAKRTCLKALRALTPAEKCGA